MAQFAFIFFLLKTPSPPTSLYPRKQLNRDRDYSSDVTANDEQRKTPKQQQPPQKQSHHPIDDHPRTPDEDIDDIDDDEDDAMSNDHGKLIYCKRKVIRLRT